MDILDEKGKRERNYLPFPPETSAAAVSRAEKTGWSCAKVRAHYHASRTSLWRWKKRSDGTAESLKDKSHRPKSPHPKATSAKAKYKIACYLKRNPSDSTVEIWAKTVRHVGSEKTGRQGIEQIVLAAKHISPPLFYSHPARKTFIAIYDCFFK